MKSPKNSSKTQKLKYGAALILLCSLISGCAKRNVDSNAADVIILNGRVYTYTWNDPSPEGAPAANAPFQDGQWHPDAEAIAIKDDLIIAVGDNAKIEAFRGDNTTVIDAQNGVVLPGLIESHTHVEGIGRNAEQINLREAKNEEEAVALIAEHAQNVPKGEWIIGAGWDEGAWASNYPDLKLLSEKTPNHPVVMTSLHGFALWCNKLALEKAGIDRNSKAPVGGEIVRDAAGNPTGLFMNRATSLVSGAVPAPTIEQLKRWVQIGLEEMARSGFVSVHIAGVGTDLMQALEELEAKKKLILRVYAMISARDESLMRKWMARGPDKLNDSMLIVRSVKGHHDGALGSRGARLLEDYADRPGHRGLSGADYGYNQDLVAEMINAGFQAGVHAIGDAGNRETLDFFTEVYRNNPEAKNLRHRIEHAQIVHPDDFKRFGELKIIASMEPPHAVEDKAWAIDRLGAGRMVGAYAWRTLRKSDALLIFNSDLTGSDHSIFYGLHAAITRRSKDLQPPEGWRMQEAVTPEEAVRAYTVWPAYASFMEQESGSIAPGKWADLTIMDVDPHNLTIENAEKLFDGKILATVVGGRVVYQNP